MDCRPVLYLALDFLISMHSCLYRWIGDSILPTLPWRAALVHVAPRLSFVAFKWAAQLLPSYEKLKYELQRGSDRHSVYLQSFFRPLQFYSNREYIFCRRMTQRFAFVLFIETMIPSASISLCTDVVQPFDWCNKCTGDVPMICLIVKH